MSTYRHTVVTALYHSRQWEAAVSALLIELEGSDMAEFLTVASGANGYTSLTLVPCGSSVGRDLWAKHAALGGRIESMADQHRADWCSTEFGEGGDPVLRTNHHAYRAGKAFLKR